MQIFNEGAGVAAEIFHELPGGAQLLVGTFLRAGRPCGAYTALKGSPLFSKKACSYPRAQVCMGTCQGFCKEVATLLPTQGLAWFDQRSLFWRKTPVVLS